VVECAIGSREVPGERKPVIRDDDDDDDKNNNNRRLIDWSLHVNAHRARTQSDSGIPTAKHMDL